MNNRFLENNKENLNLDFSETIVSFITADPLTWLDENTNIAYEAYIKMSPEQQLKMVRYNVEEYLSNVREHINDIIDISYITAKLHAYISTLF